MSNLSVLDIWSGASELQTHLVPLMTTDCLTVSFTGQGQVARLYSNEI